MIGRRLKAFPEHLSLSFSKRKTGFRSFEQSYEIWLTDQRYNPKPTVSGSAWL